MLIALLAAMLLISLYFNYFSFIQLAVSGHGEDNLHLINEDLDAISKALQKKKVRADAFSELRDEFSEDSNSIDLQLINISFDENGIVDSIYH